MAMAMPAQPPEGTLLRAAKAPEDGMRLGVGEILVVLALALLFFGPSKLPQLGASLGQALKSFKKGLNSLHDDVDLSAAVHEERKDVPPELSESTGSPAERKPAPAGEREKAPPS
jgi:sec-independent protein translocase protein TatA